MGKWIHRGVALAIFIPWAIFAPSGRHFLCFGPFVWWFMLVFGLLLILGAEWLDDRFGSTTGASYVGIIKFLGWGHMLAPVVWNLIVWAMMRS